MEPHSLGVEGRRSVDVLEVSHRLALSDRDWLARILRAVREARPVSGMDLGAVGFFFQATPGELALRTWDHALPKVPGGVTGEVMGEVMGALGALHAHLPPEAVQAVLLRPAALFATLGQLGVSVGPRAAALGIQDVLVLQAMDGSGVGCALLFALPARIRVDSRVRAYWQAVALHLRAAMRLRRNLRAAAEVVHAAGQMADGNARATLRRMVEAVDQIPAEPRPAGATRMGDEPGRVRAMPTAWPALVSGQWTLVDRFDSGGRRYYIALRNQAGAEAVVELTRRERQVLALAVQGALSKTMADTLNSSESTVNTQLASAMSKLRMRRRSELPWLDADVETWQMHVGDSALLIMRTRDDPARLLDGFGLTGAEKAVITGMLAGLSNDEIAHERGVRPRTVANQVQAIFRKTRVCSRAELCASMARRG